MITKERLMLMMKNVIKKMLTVTLVAISVLSFSGCGMRPASIPSENMIKISEFEDTSSGINGICKTLKDKESVPDDCVKMLATVIGAESGYRFDKLKVNGSIFSMELYEFKDTKGTQAKTVIESVKKGNQFDMFGRTVSYCYLSDNGKYLLIYPDEKSVSDKGDDVENVNKLKEVMEIINKAK